MKVLFVDSVRSPLMGAISRSIRHRVPGTMVERVTTLMGALAFVRSGRPHVIIVSGRSNESETGPDILAAIRVAGYQARAEVLLTGGRGLHATKLAQLDKVQRVTVADLPDIKPMLRAIEILHISMN